MIKRKNKNIDITQIFSPFYADYKDNFITVRAAQRRALAALFN